MPLTSNLQTAGVVITNDDLKEGFLPKQSVVTYEKAGVVDKRLLVKRIGALRPEIFQTILERWVSFVTSVE